MGRHSRARITTGDDTSRDSSAPAVAIFFRLVFLCVLSAQASAQISVSALDMTEGGGALLPSGVGLRFERNVNTFGWDASGRYTVADSAWDASVAELFRRSLVRTDRDNIRDEQNLRAAFGRRLSSTLSARGVFSSFIFSDNRAIGINDLSNTKFQAGLAWQPMDVLLLYPAGGYGYDKQLGILDRGPILAGRALLVNLPVGISGVSGEAWLLNEYLTPRFQQDERAGAELQTVFTPSNTNTARMQYRMTRKDVYLDPNAGTVYRRIETRADRILSVFDQLRFEAGDDFGLTASIDVSQRNVARTRSNAQLDDPNFVFDSDIGEFRINGVFGVLYQPSDATRGELRVEWNERDETHELRRPTGVDPDIYLRKQKLEEQKNNAISQFQMSFAFQQVVTDDDTLSASGSAMRMRYDTPSALNVDDRDEAFFVAGLRWSRRLGASLIASLTADANLRHTVYIFAARSANNSWNRVFRLSPSMMLARERFQSRLTAEVLANYTVYDFGALPLSLESFFLRQLVISDTATAWLTGTFAVDAQVFLRFYERGALNWNAFTINPAAYFDERTIAVTLRAVRGALSCGAGFRIFQQFRYKYNDTGARINDGTLTSLGPVCRLALTRADGSGITAEGWYQITSGTGASRVVTPNVTVQARWAM